VCGQNNDIHLSTIMPAHRNGHDDCITIHKFIKVSVDGTFWCVRSQQHGARKWTAPLVETSPLHPTG
jgi:hypothetical protein